VKTNVTITAPEELFSLAELEAKLIGVVDKINDSSLQDFEATVATFEHKPDFRQERARNDGGIIAASVSTDDENYARLNYGTDDHIVGAGGKFMSFYPGYIPKTHPGVLHSGPGRHTGDRQGARGPWVVRGIEAREFDKFIAQDHEDIFYEGVDKAFTETVSKTGGKS